MTSLPPALRLEPGEYRARDGRAVAAQLGRFTVPLRRAAPADGVVELALVRLPARNPARAGDATVFLTGGPGLSAIASGRGRLFALFETLRGHGDVILLDQRGCGESTPTLACDDPFRVPLDQALTRGAFTAAAVAAMRRCAAQHAARGMNLSAFNTVESADDVADLARALGYERVGLLGWSYGSHLAMAVMRRHRDIVSRVVLAGPEGPDHTFKLPSRVHAQLEWLSRRAGLDAASAVRTVLARLEKAPARVAWDERGAVALLGQFDVQWVLAEALADTRTLAVLPAVLSNLVTGDYRDLATQPVLGSSAGPRLAAARRQARCRTR
jgi:pimeloyl-ACP methyl ester carboxylesterase